MEKSTFCSFLQIKSVLFGKTLFRLRVFFRRVAWPFQGTGLLLAATGLLAAVSGPVAATSGPVASPVSEDAGIFCGFLLRSRRFARFFS